MKTLTKNIVFASALMLVGLMLSCESNFKDIQKINSTSFFPSSEAEKINMTYVDSGRVKAILVSPKMLNFSELTAPFTEFPKGIHLTVFDDQNQKNYVVSDYAINYTKKDLIDLRGRVVITTHDGKKLETPQLYYDQKNDWFFTEQRYKISDPEQNFTEGNGIDFDSKFQTVTTKNSYAESIKKD